jgi:hypothetical protein
MLRGALVAVLAGGLAGALTALAGDARPAAACSCAVQADPDAFGAADVVFVGTLEQIDHADGARAARAFTFGVDEVRKGDAAPRQVVRTPGSGAGCGLELAGRGPFLVFATVRPAGDEVELGRGELYAGLCGGTRSIAVGGPLDPSVGAEARPPNPDLVVEPPGDGSSALDVILRAVLLVVFVAVGAVGVWAVFLDRSPGIAVPGNLPPPPSRDGPDDHQGDHP